MHPLSEYRMFITPMLLICISIVYCPAPHAPEAKDAAVLNPFRPSFYKTDCFCRAPVFAGMAAHTLAIDPERFCRTYFPAPVCFIGEA